MKPNKTHSSSSPKRSDLKEKGVFGAKGSFKIQRHNTISLSLALHFNGKVDSLDHIKGSNSLDQMTESGAIGQPEPQKQMLCEKHQATVHEEIRRMSRLPANSTYVTHRLRVLNKILQLMSIQISCYVRELYHRRRSWSCFLVGCLCERIITVDGLKFGNHVVVVVSSSGAGS